MIARLEPLRVDEYRYKKSGQRERMCVCSLEEEEEGAPGDGDLNDSSTILRVLSS